MYVVYAALTVVLVKFVDAGFATEAHSMPLPVLLSTWLRVPALSRAFNITVFPRVSSLAEAFTALPPRNTVLMALPTTTWLFPLFGSVAPAPIRQLLFPVMDIIV
jgi:hypothetical protein